MAGLAAGRAEGAQLCWRAVRRHRLAMDRSRPLISAERAESRRSGPVSGCHVNPAVTMGALLAGRIPLAEAVGYWVAQFVGGILGALLLWGMFNTSPLYSTAKTGLGTNGWGAASDIHIGVGGAFLAEVVLTALFVFVILGVTSKLGNAATAAIAIGLTLTVVHLIGIPITGTSVNPARSLGLLFQARPVTRAQHMAVEQGVPQREIRRLDLPPLMAEPDHRGGGEPAVAPSRW